MTSKLKQQAQISNETSPLLQTSSVDQSRSRRDDDDGDGSRRDRCGSGVAVIAIIMIAVAVLVPIYLARTQMSSSSSSREDLLATTSKENNNSNRHTPTTKSFPPDFIWGAATSSYQIEGAVQERGWTVWDTFCHQSPSPILDNSTGDIACDHYHLYKQDIESIMKRGLNLTAYRFSMAWSRILPTGQVVADGIHQPGVDFYNHLIDTLLANNILPVVTLFHWDTPQALQDKYGGWMNPQTADIFANDYARTAFELFGDRVQYWITLNEPWTVAVNGYSTGIHAPGHHNATEPYIVAHNLLLAHAKTVLLYKQYYQQQQQGKIGIANSGDYRYAASSQQQDHDAAERAMLFQFGWFVDPLILGDYPAVMRERVGDRLPVITSAERGLFLKASTDFLGLNYYSVLVASVPKKEADYVGYWADIHVNFTSRPNWKHNAMGWPVVPEGLEKMLLWISHRYNYPTIFITENGSAEDESSREFDIVLNDTKRQAYIREHLCACARAIPAGVHLAGYFVWSLMDNFEWQFGYTRRFGIYHVNFDTLERLPKSSALFYRRIIQENGENLREISDKKETGTRLLREGNHRKLPDRILMGYTKGTHGVRKAVQDGVNIIVWSFVDFVKDIKSSENGRRLEESNQVTMRTNLNISQVKELIKDLDTTGYDYVVHLMAVGGWNEPHLDPNVSPLEWFAAFKETGFHGIDWDLEGNDDVTSPRNFFTMACLDRMGEISRLVHQAGYYVSMAPPQSYLDIHASHKFIRYVNLTDKARGWHEDFSYFGRNVYAYLLKQYGEWIDLVSIQFYESYSRAAQAIYVDSVLPSHYLTSYVQQLALTNQSFWVDFSQDPAVTVNPGNVSLPLSKLVLGFANGWAKDNNDKVVYIPPSEVNSAWQSLKEEQILPRGFMFWTIDEEGSNGVNLARDLGMILNAQCIE